jgi:hypothetical protein
VTRTDSSIHRPVSDDTNLFHHPSQPLFSTPSPDSRPPASGPSPIHDAKGSTKYKYNYKKHSKRNHMPHLKTRMRPPHTTLQASEPPPPCVRHIDVTQATTARPCDGRQARSHARTVGASKSPISRSQPTTRRTKRRGSRHGIIKGGSWRAGYLTVDHRCGVHPDGANHSASFMHMPMQSPALSFRYESYC